MSSYITLEEFLNLFTKETPATMEDYVKNAKVRIRNNVVPLRQYLDDHNCGTIRNIEPLYEHITNREQYLTRFYNMSLRIQPTDTPIIAQAPTALNNNSQPLLKNRIRNLFLKEILSDTKSGFDNIPSFLEVLFDLYQYPNSIIDYKLITPSAIAYMQRGRIGSIFSSFYFRASIMNPALVHNIRANFFPNATTILSPTLGWCSYLAGFSHEKDHIIKHYVGIDVINRVCHTAQHTPLTLYPPETINIYNCPSEMVMSQYPEFATQYHHYFDAVFFSPPYYRMELYEGGEQSTTNYNTYEEWLQQYWEKTVIMCKHTVKPHTGIFSYIVSPFDGYNLPDDLAKIAQKYFKLQRIVPIYNKNVNSTKHREPNDRLYIFTSPL
jgi:hypothetical protein